MLVTTWMWDPYVLGFEPALKFLRNQLMCKPYKGLSDETILVLAKVPSLYTDANRYNHTNTLNITQSMSGFGGLWKHQHNTTCAKV